MVNQKGIAPIIIILVVAILVGGFLVYRYFYPKILAPQIEIKEEVETPKVEELKEPETRKSIQEILLKVEQIGPLEYEATIVSSPVAGGREEMVTRMKIWEKKPYMRIEEEIFSGIFPFKMVIIRYPEKVYLALLNDKPPKYTEITEKEEIESVVEKFLSEKLKGLQENPTLKEVGTETIDGRKTRIFEYTTGYEKVGFTEILSTQGKVWIEEDSGIPLKTAELITTFELDKEITKNVEAELKNFVFGDIPEYIFDTSKVKTYWLKSQ